MISELVNTLFLTFIASEYLIVVDERGDGIRDNLNESSKNNRCNNNNFVFVILTPLVILTNILDHINDAPEFIEHILQKFLHLPRITFAASAYVLALYIDVRRYSKTLTTKAFFSKVGISFLKVIPAYPFLAVIISFVFLFVISFFESLHLPTQWLNWPIYYGTLYGPFVWVYMSVKRRVCREISSTRSELPYFTNNRKQLSVIFEEGSDICWQTRGWWKG